MPKKIAKGFFKAALTVALITVLTALFCIMSFAVYAATAPDLEIDEFKALAKAQDRTTKLYYVENVTENGYVLKELESEALFSEQNREWIKYEQLPKNLINAFVAIEDHRFFEHKGIDTKRTAGAIVGFITGKTSYGGSTLDQQLIKNITGEDNYSVSRKVKEMIRAVRLDRALTKEEILELYLNTIYLSENSYGVGTAAETYFEKEVDELTLTECAAIACIPQSPTKWDPRANPENNKQRRMTVLLRMKELGFISEDECQKASDEELVLSNDRTRNRENEQIHSWYTESVIDEAVGLLVKNKVAKNEQTARKLLYTGGLNIVTAQNPKMQKAVEEYFACESNFYRSGLLIHPECSMVVIDPKTGGVLALAGATGEKSANRTLNYATATRRSPGSSIKPVSVYAPALDKGYITYGSVIDDTPYKFVSNGYGGMRGWPQNYPQGYRGLTTVRDAIARSVNTVAVKVLDKLTPEYSFELLESRMKISSLVSSSASNGSVYTDIAPSPLALGQLTRGVTVKEMTACYTSLAGGGVFNEGKTVLKILDADGEVLVDNSGKGDRIFTEQSAAIMTKLLMGVTNSGTASKMKLKNRIECAGKTGTTNSDCDRWFIGYTPELLAGVWFGFPTPKSLDGYPALPSPALKTFDEVIGMLSTEEYLGHAPITRFPETEGIVTAKYCKDSGKLVSSACLCDPRGSRIETGYFTKETVPKEYCQTHRLVLYDTVGGGIAGPDCPRERCRYVGLLNVSRSFPYDTVIADSQYTYQYLSGGVPPCLDSSKPYFYYNPGAASSGRSAVSVPFNRYCSGCHLEALFPEEKYEDDETPNGENEL